MGEQPLPAYAAPASMDAADDPAYTTGRAAEMLGVRPDFLRSLEAAGFLDPQRSGVGIVGTRVVNSPWLPACGNYWTPD